MLGGTERYDTNFWQVHLLFLSRKTSGSRIYHSRISRTQLYKLNAKINEFTLHRWEINGYIKFTLLWKQMHFLIILLPTLRLKWKLSICTDMYVFMFENIKVFNMLIMYAIYLQVISTEIFQGLWSHQKLNHISYVRKLYFNIHGSSRRGRNLFINYN